ncbi:MAG: DUF504 domain-containing protein [Candidatus Marsarchaeota archaeon]|nr:DUF504 domain-containing protein [Candidatus Marsarchaeota archaeon]
MHSVIRDVLNRLRWDESLRGEARVCYVSREHGVERLVDVNFSEVTDISKSYFRVGEGVDAKYIPYHRVTWIAAGSKVLWRSRRWGERIGRGGVS